MLRSKKTLSVLIIPDGERQTFTFKIRYFFVKLLFIFLLIFCGLLIFGTISYWELAKIALDYNEVEALNQKLLSDNSKINEIAESLSRIRETDERIRDIFSGDYGAKIEFREGEFQPGDKIKSGNNLTYLNPLQRGRAPGNAGDFARGDVLASYPTFVPIEGDISNNFSIGNENKRGGHYGVDIVARELSVIRAAGDGIVMVADWSVNPGNQIIIDHQNGYISIYKHNASLMVSERQFIRQGDAIALLGNSGKSTAPHLHFEIWKNYKPINPITIWALTNTEPPNVRN